LKQNIVVRKIAEVATKEIRIRIQPQLGRDRLGTFG
jgi:hypothetical protein